MEENYTGTVQLIAITPDKRAHLLTVGVHKDGSYQKHGTVPCALCGEHNVAIVEDCDMHKDHPHFPVLVHGVKIPSLYPQDDAEFGEVLQETYYYDFRFNYAFPVGLPRVVDGHVVFY